MLRRVNPIDHPRGLRRRVAQPATRLERTWASNLSPEACKLSSNEVRPLTCAPQEKINCSFTGPRFAAAAAALALCADQSQIAGQIYINHHRGANADHGNSTIYLLMDSLAVGKAQRFCLRILSGQILRTRAVKNPFGWLPSLVWWSSSSDS